MRKIDLDYLEISGIIHFKNASAARACSAKKIRIPGTNLTFSPSYFVGNSTLDGMVPLEKEIGIKQAVGLAISHHRSIMVGSIPASKPHAIPSLPLFKLAPRIVG